jgi:hypothetical protein
LDLPLGIGRRSGGEAGRQAVEDQGEAELEELIQVEVELQAARQATTRTSPGGAATR